MGLNIKYKYCMSEQEVSFDGTQEQKSGVLFMKQSAEKQGLQQENNSLCINK